MKKIFLVLGVFVCFALSAQQNDEFKTIFGGRSISGYGSLGGGFSPINQDNAMVFNARGGVVMGHVFAMGLGGTGFLTEYQYNPSMQQKASLTGGYGGLFVELIVLGRSPVHISFPVLVGLGGASYTAWENEGSNDYQRENTVEDVATFGVFEPGVELEFNLTRFLRLAGYFNYRYASNLDLTKIVDGQSVQLVTHDALNCYSAGIILKFGKF